MLTIRRPILATGAFDVDVELKKPQNIFWSVGYKSASMRKNHKPVKNLDPITIEFGRNPAWKCPEENDQARFVVYIVYRVCLQLYKFTIFPSTFSVKVNQIEGLEIQTLINQDDEFLHQ